MMKTDGYHYLGRLAGHEVGVDRILGRKDIFINRSDVARRLACPGG